ncbi:E3 Ubiquitin ligase [Haladaptatus litoreus]|uniref:RING-type E3 ubiquitin transferase n=1 Tax=Haladaptatus litoreus TaxID=553468 RepID=A0A1N7B696_9EURY|nr:GIDE domain-containing protein [Haladaptatus litoreus]SIR46828.1 E3 Ubiquitin ligase [Haladaptatus litoreus]
MSWKSNRDWRFCQFSSRSAQNPDTLLAAWEVKEWSESGGTENWQTLASGIRSVPFVVNDGTGEIRVDIGDRVDDGTDWLPNERAIANNGTAVDDLTCIFKDWPVTEVGAESETPQYIREFITGESSVGEQSGSITNLVDVGNSHGDRRYYEQTLSPGDDIYLLGNVHAERGATTPLQADDAVIEPVDGERFVISDRDEDELTNELSGNYRRSLALSGGLVVLGIGLIIATALSIV